uniref:Antitoxin n=1 Tax=viral metagenome TaxID=1070528 RepID=A0A6M3IDY9_9ZZZZ
MTSIKPITLEIEKELWTKFKEMTPRTVRLNDAIVELIAKKVATKR